MLSILWLLIREYCHGLYHSFTGLSLIFSLDNDVTAVVLNPNARPDRKLGVLEQRRVNNGVPLRPAEPIIRYKVPAWRRILQCVSVNMLCMLAFWIFSNGLWFLLSFFTDHAELGSSITTRLLVVPMFLFSRILMVLWFADIASACDRTLKMPDAKPLDFRVLLANFFFSLVLEYVFLGQAILVAYLPIPGFSFMVSFLHMALLNALYSFEYIWTSRNLTVQKQLDRLHSNWPYYVGFGTLLTVATTLSSNFIINGCLFGALFPFFIISSYHAQWKRLQEDMKKEPVPPFPIMQPSKVVADKIVTSSINLFEFAS